MFENRRFTGKFTVKRVQPMVNYSELLVWRFFVVVIENENGWNNIDDDQTWSYYLYLPIGKYASNKTPFYLINIPHSVV
jgi:hypothetical protein